MNAYTLLEEEDIFARSTRRQLLVFAWFGDVKLMTEGFVDKKVIVAQGMHDCYDNSSWSDDIVDGMSGGNSDGKSYEHSGI